MDHPKKPAMVVSTIAIRQIIWSASLMLLPGWLANAAGGNAGEHDRSPATRVASQQVPIVGPSHSCPGSAVRCEVTRCRPGTHKRQHEHQMGPGSAVHRLRAAPRPGHEVCHGRPPGPRFARPECKLVPAIHALAVHPIQKTWMPATSAGMTSALLIGLILKERSQRVRAQRGPMINSGPRLEGLRRCFQE
jgi:hypothetical protein